MKKILLILMLLSLTNCASNKSKSHMSSAIGATAGYGICHHMLNSGVGLTAACTVVGAFAGANAMYKSDYDVHNAVFVDHLNTSGTGSSYTNWYNSKTGNSGIIHVTRSYMQGPLKCKEYDATVDISSSWPLIGIGNVNREVIFGTACQLPDGRWIEKR